MQTTQQLKALSDEELLHRIHLSEHEAYLRIAAARASREHPVILDMLADGRLHLTAIALLAPHLTRGNGDALLDRATHKTKRELEGILAELEPRPDVRPSIRKLLLGRVSLRVADYFRSKWIRVLWTDWFSRRVAPG